MAPIKPLARLLINQRLVNAVDNTAQRNDDPDERRAVLPQRLVHWCPAALGISGATVRVSGSLAGFSQVSGEPDQERISDPIMEPSPMVPLSDSFFAVVLELAPDAIAVTDELGRIVQANAYFEELFGYNREELLGHTVEMLMPERVRSAHREHRHAFDQLHVARPMGTTAVDLRGLCADGTEFSIEVGLSPVSTHHGIRTIMAVHPTGGHRAGERADERAVQADRERLATSLNDQVIHSILCVGLKLSGLLDDATLRQHAVLNPAIDQLNKAVCDIRDILSDHHPHGGGGEPVQRL